MFVVYPIPLQSSGVIRFIFLAETDVMFRAKGK
jgi:hypothetical protein